MKCSKRFKIQNLESLRLNSNLKVSFPNPKALLTHYQFGAIRVAHIFIYNKWKSFPLVI